MSTEMKKIGKERQYYTRSEVRLHNSRDDCWVSLFGEVFDLTELLQSLSVDEEKLLSPILRFAGLDVSRWFDEKTRDVKKSLDPERGVVLPVLPYGRFLHVAPLEPVSNWSTAYDKPWWQDEKYCIGTLSSHTRSIIIRNMLTFQETPLEVCEEETLYEIQDRYLDWNQHAESYTWKILDEDYFRPLDMNLTLTENDIPDENEDLEKLAIAKDSFIPIIHVYFNDDLTEA